MMLKQISAALALLAVTATASSAQTLNAVKARGELLCGVSEGLAGFSLQEAGQWNGLDVDLCRAIAAAIFNDPAKVRFVPLSTSDRFQALRTSRIDVLARNSTWTMGRETELGLVFAAVNYYDGQGFMVRKALNIDSAQELDGKAICLQTGATTEPNLADYGRANKLTFRPISFNSAEETLRGYEGGRCEALTTDISGLHAQRTRLAKPADHIILPDVISKEPLGPAVRQGDGQWLNIVKWTHHAMVNAEELGVGRATISEAMQSPRPAVRRLLGLEDSFGEQIGLTKDWAARAIRHVGNYSEVFERNVGTGSKLAIPRGVNNLWDKGGILYAPPIR